MNKIDHAEILDPFIEKCRKHGLKVTPQRMVIYRELLKATDHPSIDRILKKVRVVLPNISFDTVYRTVLSFVDAGIINIVEGHGGSKRFDPKISPHHHFRCTKCEKIVDFYNEYLDRIKIPEEVERQFCILRKKVLLEGVCPACGRKK